MVSPAVAGGLARPSRAGVAPAGLLAQFQSSLSCDDFLFTQALGRTWACPLRASVH